MSSVEVSELTSREHKNVMRDIRDLLDQGVSQLNFELTSYRDKQGKERPCYKLTKKGSLILASGYNAVLREKIIDRWEALETGQATPMCNQPQLPTDYLSALKALVAAEEEKLQLQLANQSMQPKAVYFDNLVERNLLTNFRDTAKQIHVPQNKFIELLLENKYLYRDQKGNLKPYSDYTPKYFEIKDWERNGKAGTQVLVTPQGKEAFRLMWGGMSYEN